MKKPLISMAQTMPREKKTSANPHTFFMTGLLSADEIRFPAGPGGTSLLQDMIFFVFCDRLSFLFSGKRL